MNCPKVSVIIPVYNAEKWLNECIDSILTQSLKEIEVICIDAGSTDASTEILNEYVKKDSRLIISAGHGRLDAGLARNIGLDIATGEYLSILDADDYFEENMLRDAYNKAVSDKAEIVIYPAQQLDMRTGEISEMPWSLKLNNCPKHTPFSPLEMRRKLFNSFQNWTWNKLFSAKLVKSNHIVFQSIERTNDMAFTCEALALAKSLTILPKAYTVYRVGTGTSLQQTNDVAPTCFWEAYKETRKRLINDGVYNLFKQSFINAAFTGTMYNLRSVRTDEAHREIMYLLKYESNEFEFDEHTRFYFYDYGYYRDYKRYKKTVKTVKRLEEKPKITVVLPCLNSKAYIRECIESIMGQELTEIEILVVDAGSTDGTIEVLRQYVEIDPRVRIIHSEKKSYGYQINLGLNEAKGDYFAIVESDDYIRPNMYKELYQVAEKNELQVLKADYIHFYGSHKKRRYEEKRIIPFKELYNRVLDPEKEEKVFRNYVVSWCGIYKTDFLKENRIYHHESMGASFQDNGFWFQVFTKAHRVMFYNKAYYMLRRDNPGSSIYSASKAYCMFAEYDFIREYLARNPELEKKYVALCAYKRFKNYLWANERLVSDENRKEYIERFSTSFMKIYENGEIKKELYSDEEYSELMLIINNPELYYEQYQMKQRDSSEILDKDEYINRLLQEKEQLQRLIKNKENAIKKLKEELCGIKEGYSYRIGRGITYLPRKMRGGIQCYRNNGLVYTIKHFFEKINNRLR